MLSKLNYMFNFLAYHSKATIDNPDLKSDSKKIYIRCDKHHLVMSAT